MKMFLICVRSRLRISVDCSLTGSAGVVWLVADPLPKRLHGAKSLFWILIQFLDRLLQTILRQSTLVIGIFRIHFRRGSLFYLWNTFHSLVRQYLHIIL